MGTALRFEPRAAIVGGNAHPKGVSLSSAKCGMIYAMIRIKICGITRPDDARAAADAGADAIGLVFADSPRQVTIDHAREIIAALPPYVGAVGVFVDAPLEDVLQTSHAVHLGEIQLHGDESPDYVRQLCGVAAANSRRDNSSVAAANSRCDSTVAPASGAQPPSAGSPSVAPVSNRCLRLRVTKALRVRDSAFLEQLRAYRGCGVAAILLDAFSKRVRRGAGAGAPGFDWDLVAESRKAGALDDCPPLVLAGGLTPLNVAAGIRRIRPWGVDVSGGVETEPGVKCAESIARFIAAARGAT